MTTTASENQVQAFYEFLGRQLSTGRSPATPEASVGEFRQYQDELRGFSAGTVEALKQSQAGQTRPLDVEALMQRVQSRLAAEEQVS